MEVYFGRHDLTHYAAAGGIGADASRQVVATNGDPSAEAGMRSGGLVE